MRANSTAASTAAVFIVAAAALILAPASRAGPPNDRYDHAQAVGTVPAQVVGTTKGARQSEGEPAPWCASVKGVVWYSVQAPRHGGMVAQLKADGQLDAAVAVYRVIRSQRSQVRCAQTNASGHAVVSWYGFTTGSYMIGVAQRAGSSAGSFRLNVVAADPAPAPPGPALPDAGASGTVDPILDAADAWSFQMTRGTTYRINLTSPSGLVGFEIYLPDTYSFRQQKPVRVVPNGGYLVFTPGVAGGGLYSIVVRTQGYRPVSRPYRLQAQVAGTDDIAPGVKLANGQTVNGSIQGGGIDVLDLYRFSVPRPNALTTITLQQKPTVGLDLLVLTETGSRVAGAVGHQGKQVLLQHLRVGHYFVVVRSHDESSGSYQLQVLVRDITTTSVSPGGSRFFLSAPGTSIPITVRVTAANVGGRVAVLIDKHDPLASWQFSATVPGRVDSSGTVTLAWTPPAVGHWRMRARFLGTPFSSFSQSGYAYVYVAEPLT